MAECECCKRIRQDVLPEVFQRGGAYGSLTSARLEELAVPLCGDCKARVGDHDSAEHKWLSERIS